MKSVCKISIIAFVFISGILISGQAFAAVSNGESIQVNEASNGKPPLVHDNSWNEHRVQKKLEKIGVPQKTIDQMSWRTKLSLAKSDIKKFLGYSESSFDIPEVDENGNLMVGTFALEDDVDFNIYTGVVGSHNGDPYIVAHAEYDWNDMPFWTLTDGFAVSWSDGWVYDTHNFTEYQEKCIGEYLPGGGYDPCGGGTYWDSSTPTYKDREKLGGIGWGIDLKSNSQDAYGVAEVYLIGADYSGDYGQIKAWYAHDSYEADLSISASIATDPGAAAGVTFDESQTSISDSELIDHSLLD